MTKPSTCWIGFSSCLADLPPFSRKVSSHLVLKEEMSLRMPEYGVFAPKERGVDF